MAYQENCEVDSLKLSLEESAEAAVPVVVVGCQAQSASAGCRKGEVVADGNLVRVGGSSKEAGRHMAFQGNQDLVGIHMDQSAG